MGPNRPGQAAGRECRRDRAADTSSRFSSNRLWITRSRWPHRDADRAVQWTTPRRRPRRCERRGAPEGHRAAAHDCTWCGQGRAPHGAVSRCGPYTACRPRHGKGCAAPRITLRRRSRAARMWVGWHRSVPPQVYACPLYAV